MDVSSNETSPVKGLSYHYIVSFKLLHHRPIYSPEAEVVGIMGLHSSRGNGSSITYAKFQPHDSMTFSYTFLLKWGFTLLEESGTCILCINVLCRVNHFIVFQFSEIIVAIDRWLLPFVSITKLWRWKLYTYSTEAKLVFHFTNSSILHKNASVFGKTTILEYDYKLWFEDLQKW